MTTTPTTHRADQGVRIVRQLMDFDHDDFLASLADDVQWAVPGNWEGVSGVKDKAAIAAFLPGLQAIFPHGLRTEIVRATADADTAVVEIRCCAETVNGVDYDNRYCFALDFERDAVRRIREYTDTLYADRALFS
jgi:ketosteroid isomerase-like protein